MTRKNPRRFENNTRTHTLYELPLGSLTLTVGGSPGSIPVDVTALLASGRANYIIFQHLVAACTGWRGNSEGGDSDLITADAKKVEVKAYLDKETHPSDTKANIKIHTAASSTFGPNNHGPEINRLVKEGNYTQALAICRRSGYDKNDLYIYTNTRHYKPGTPLRYLILPKKTVVKNLSRQDPRIIERPTLLSQVTDTREVDVSVLG